MAPKTLLTKMHNTSRILSNKVDVHSNTAKVMDDEILVRIIAQCLKMLTSDPSVLLLPAFSHHFYFCDKVSCVNCHIESFEIFLEVRV